MLVGAMDFLEGPKLSCQPLRSLPLKTISIMAHMGIEKPLVDGHMNLFGVTFARAAFAHEDGNLSV